MVVHDMHSDAGDLVRDIFFTVLTQKLQKTISELVEIIGLHKSQTLRTFENNY